MPDKILCPASIIMKIRRGKGCSLSLLLLCGIGTKLGGLTLYTKKIPMFVNNFI